MLLAEFGRNAENHKFKTTVGCFSPYEKRKTFSSRTKVGGSCEERFFGLQFWRLIFVLLSKLVIG
ncbi:hypothetical protein CXF70_07205 [Planomicrobium sp. MB-3u-38]|nr:hypothetical protein CXF70_07205 [Planomicrobium sp. MB-3u-38]